MSLIQTLLALAFGTGTNELGLHRFLAGFGCSDLRFGLINAGKRFGDLGVLQLALATIVFDGGTGSFNGRGGLVNLRAVVVVLQFDNEVTFVHSLIVGHMHRAHDTGHLGAQRCKVAADVSVISHLFDFAALPGIPVASDGDQDRQGERHNKERSYELLPSGATVRGRGSFAVSGQRFGHGGGGFSRYRRTGHYICSFSSKKSANAALYA